MSDATIRNLERLAAAGDLTAAYHLEHVRSRVEEPEPWEWHLVARTVHRGKLHLLNPTVPDFGPDGRAGGGAWAPLTSCLRRAILVPHWERLPWGTSPTHCNNCRPDESTWELQVAFGIATGTPLPALFPRLDMHRAILRRVEQRLAKAGRWVSVAQLLD